MRKRGFLFFILLAMSLLPFFQSSIQAAGTITSSPEWETELWEGKVLTAKFRVGICYARDGKAKGVLLLKHSNGQEDPYHLYGTLNNNSFDLSHSSGHFFSGRLTGPESMEGKVRLRNGMRMTLKGKRIRNARLAAGDCAPLQ